MRKILIPLFFTLLSSVSYSQNNYEEQYINLCNLIIENEIICYDSIKIEFEGEWCCFFGRSDSRKEYIGFDRKFKYSHNGLCIYNWPYKTIFFHDIKRFIKISCSYIGKNVAKFTFRIIQNNNVTIIIDVEYFIENERWEIKNYSEFHIQFTQRNIKIQ